VDTASVYGNAEAVLGEVITTINLRPKLFVATKLEAPEPAELKRSQGRLKIEKIDDLLEVMGRGPGAKYPSARLAVS
jgi:diketogulonate reductase-like aldo/keto reductase